MLPWILVIMLAAGLALSLWRWRRTQAEKEALEVALSSSDRALRELSQTAEGYTAQLQALLQARVDPELVVAADGTLLEANTAARNLFGPQAELGQTLMMFTRSVELSELVDHCLAGGADCDRQVRLGPTHAAYRARAVRVGDPTRAPRRAGVVLSLQDLTELQRLGRARRDFVANISHELRTPVTSILLLVDTLRGQAAADPQARGELLERISVEAEAIAQLSQELLDLAQIESGQALLRLVPTRVADLIGGVTGRLSAQAARKQQTIRVEAAPDLMAWADEAQMTRALTNLVHNAIKFTPTGGEISVCASLTGDDVQLAVADSGPGIPPEDQARIFERFFRGDRSRAGGGTGLGLAIARHVVEGHGGRLWVESDGRPGKGAIFRLTLPAVEPSAAGANE
jgi:two-component system phosphate regulon sensor histidine kinase PhoR